MGNPGLGVSFALRALSLALFLSPSPAFAAGKKPATVEDFAWLAGAWVERKAGVETEEHWLAPKGGVMLGVNRTTREAGRTSFEFLRLARTTNGISYFASPGGRAATEFPLKELDGKRAVFENPAHDFPQRILYSLESDGTLRARIEGTVRGTTRSQEWKWEKMK